MTDGPFLGAFRSPHMATRLVAFGGLALVTVAFTFVAARVVHLPPGYGPGQSFTGRQLLAEGRLVWIEWRRGTILDMALFVPLYLLYGVTVLWILGRGDKQQAATWRPPALVALVLGAAADEVSTFMFRSTLWHLLHRHIPGNLVGATRVLVGVQHLFLLVAGSFLLSGLARRSHRNNRLVQVDASGGAQQGG